MSNAEKTTKAEKSKPAIFADDRSDAEKFDPALHRGALDPSRIPGYSEVVMANDIALADDLEFRNTNGQTKEDLYRQIGATPAELPIELAWLPISAVGGAPSNAQARVIDNYMNREGFRPVTYTRENDGTLSVPVLDDHGYGFPPLGRPAEDGTIRRGADTALFWRDGEVARKWKAHRAREAAEAEGRALGDTTYATGAYSTSGWAAQEDSETITVKH